MRSSVWQAKAQRLASAVAALLACLSMILVPAMAAEGSASLAVSSPSACPHPTDPTRVAKERHPVVLIHGWTGNAGSWGETIKGLTQRLPDVFDFRAFDYEAYNTDWAAHPAVADCLALYVNQLGSEHRQAGGDGRVYMVAHSMGGLAVLFASNPAYARSPIRDEYFGGLTTIGTPYQGSPFGNTVLAQLSESWDELWGPRKVLPPRTSDAAKCLARHDEKHWMPVGCDKPPAAPGKPITMISTTTTISRTLFGAKLYDVGLNTDGAVPVPSASGYLSSEYDRKGVRTQVGVRDVTCHTTSEQSLALLRGALSGSRAGLAGAVIGAEVAALGQISSDTAVLDQVISGEPGLELGTMSLVSAWLDACGHSNSPRNPEVLDRVADSLLSQWNRQRDATAASQGGGVDASGPSKEKGGTQANLASGNAIVTVFDLSGSMNDKDPTGAVKLEGAKSALEKFVLGQPASSEIGLWTYPGGDEVLGCAAGDFVGGGAVAPIGDASRLTALIDGLRADGGTPTGPALQAVVDRLTSQGYRGATILLVSDGESNCGPPPCAIAKSVAAQGFAVTINAMGFQLSPEGQKELGCIAAATGGSYVAIDDAAQLDENIRRLGIPNLEVKATGPTQAIVGQQIAITGTVTNPSSRTIEDAHVALRFADAGSQSIFPAVLPPRFGLGNIAPGETITRTWTVTAGVDVTGGTASYRISTWGKDVSATEAQGTVTVHATSDLKAAAAPWLKSITDKGSVAVVGDSYSSGEGAGNYISGTDTALNRCHRSWKTHTLTQFPEKRRDLLACSGAVIEDFFSSQQAPNSTQPENAPQIGQLRKLEVKPDLLVVTVGGNDIGFANIVRNCVNVGACDSEDYRREVFTKVSELNEPAVSGELGRLSRLYQFLYSVINDKAAVDRRHGAAPVLVLAYPAIMPRDVRGLCSGFSQSETAFANQVLERLNAEIATAVTQAAKDGRQIYFVDQTANAVQPNHTSCDPDAYIRGISLPSGALSASYDQWLSSQAQEFHVADYPSITQQFMHPNEKGYSALTVAVYSWSTVHDIDLGKAAPTTIDKAPPESSDAWPLPGTPVLQGGSASTLVPGQTVIVTADHLQPSSPVQITLHSSRRVLASTFADEKGALRQSVVIPSDATIGSHTVTIEALKDGSETVMTIPVRIRAGLPMWLVGTAVLGLLAALVSASTWLRSARRRHASV